MTVNVPWPRAGPGEEEEEEEEEEEGREGGISPREASKKKSLGRSGGKAPSARTAATPPSTLLDSAEDEE